MQVNYIQLLQAIRNGANPQQLVMSILEGEMANTPMGKNLMELAKQFIETYFLTYPGIKDYMNNTIKDAYDKGYVTTLFGRRRPIPELSSGNFMQRSFGERVAMNSPIQGSAADIMKIAMIGVYKRLKKEKLKSRLVLQVHDELLIEAHESEIETVKQILATEMEHAAKLFVPLDVEMQVGKTWYEAK